MEPNKGHGYEKCYSFYILIGVKNLCILPYLFFIISGSNFLSGSYRVKSILLLENSF